MEINIRYRYRLRWIGIIIIVILLTIGIWLLSDRLQFLRSLGYGGGFLISLIGSATIIIPAPFWVVIAAMVVNFNPIVLGIFAGLGSSLGELTGYALGYSGGSILLNKKEARKYRKEVHKKGMFAIFVLALVPNPFFDFAGVAAGAMRIPLWQFIVPCTFGKIIRFVVFLSLISLGVNHLNEWYMVGIM